MQDLYFYITFAPLLRTEGAIAQLVEQRTENPCVPGSIPGGTTPPFISPVLLRKSGLFYLHRINEKKEPKISCSLKHKLLIFFKNTNNPNDTNEPCGLFSLRFLLEV